MDTNALIKIQDIVDKYVYKRKISLDDWNLYLEHAADCVRRLYQHHIRGFNTAKVSSVSMGVFNMPSDMIDIISLSVPWNGELWTLSKKNSLDVTTIQGWPSQEVADDLVFFQEFLDRDSVERNSGIVDDTVTFSSNKAVLNGSNGYLSLPLTLDNDVYTIEIGLTPDSPSDTSSVLDFTEKRGVGTVTMSGSSFVSTSGTIYVDGTQTSSIGTSAAKHVVISGITLEGYTMLVGKNASDSNFFDGSIDYIKIYDRTWTASDVTSAYTTHSNRSATSSEDLLDTKSTGYGARGGNNIYYFLPDWKKRKIFLNGIPTETVILTYISSGLSLTGDTFVPAQAEGVIDRYLRWMQAEIDGLGITERRDRERLYNSEIMMLRRTNLPSFSEFKDIVLSMTTQTPIR